jgi:hypothetical protein
MDRQAFKTHLKRRGKKDHVAEGLAQQVEAFAGWLQQERGRDLASAQTGDLEAYARWAEERKKGSARKAVRGVALYYGWTDQAELAACAAGIREAAIAKTRRTFRLRDFAGVDPAHVEALAQAGIVDVKQMIAAGATPAMRQALSRETGVPIEAILEYVKLSDLSRLGGLKRVRARLYYDAGVDTIDKLAAWEPAALREMFVEYVECTGFDGIAPLPREVRNAVATAKTLPRLVEY